VLKRFAERSQLVVISHNRPTIESADTIDGVSMGRNEPSTALSLRLANVEVEKDCT
jgi:chromosome segregation ATPase